ncbi:hypothetical protein [Acrocarpospora corrugata]|uniref:hypothetical protein n=1 Tax=Acrocarpospora corrugata TaxID=35763 RepID=UPI0012D2E8CA|nr:hypothetical protein [Acrocarpospora corrugata]
MPGQQRLVSWTSGRVTQYAVGPLGASQLVADRPYLTGGRTDIGGRNYGVVAVDPGNAGKVVLVAGTSNHSLYLDRLSGTMTSSDGYLTLAQTYMDGSQLKLMMINSAGTGLSPLNRRVLDIRCHVPAQAACA